MPAALSSFSAVMIMALLTSTATCADSTTWRVDFFDDFDSFDSNNWQDQMLWVNDEDQCYVPDNQYNTREVSSGTLKLRVVDLGEPRPVLIGRHDGADRRADDRLRDHGRDRLGPRLLDPALDLVHARDAAARVLLAERAAQAVARGRLRKLREPGLERRAPLRVPARGERRERRAVIGELPADHLPALGPARGDVVLAHELRLPDGLVEPPEDQHSAFRWLSPGDLCAADDVHPYTKDYFA